MRIRRIYPLDDRDSQALFIIDPAEFASPGFKN
jgi:hypothetical protein